MSWGGISAGKTGALSDSASVGPDERWWMGFTRHECQPALVRCRAPARESVFLLVQENRRKEGHPDALALRA